jgi:hypothetical protein
MTTRQESRHAGWDAPPAELERDWRTPAAPPPKAGNPARAHAAVIVAALACWVAALLGTDRGRVRAGELLTGLPAAYYAGLALLAVGFAIAASRRDVERAVLACYVVALVVMLHATIGVLYPEPRHTWAYERLGGIDRIARQGSVGGSLDVYRSWPGFFALNAWLSRAAGVRAADYAAWAPLAFGLANVPALLFALRGVTRDPRLQWSAVWLFVLASWIGEDYLAPQALGFILALIVVGLVLRSGPVSLPRRLDRFAERFRRRSPPPAVPPRLGVRPAAVLGTLCAVAVVVSDPLSPLMLILALAALTVTIGRPPLWAFAALVALEAWWVFLGRQHVVTGLVSHGGDASLGAYLFVLPWLALLAAAACDATAVRTPWRLLGLTLLLGAATLFGGDVGPLRAAVGLALGLSAPGWLLLRATVAGRLAGGHAAVLTVPLSLAVCALSGTVLTLAGIGLTPLSLTLVVAAVTLACLLVARSRRTLGLALPARWPRPARPRLTPRTALAGGLAIAILGVGASTVREIVRVDDAARASTPFVALTGELQRATPVAGGMRVQVAFTIINSQPRAIRARLDISVRAATVSRQTPAIRAEGRASVRGVLVARCGDEVVARLSGDGVPARRSALRIACPG